MIGKKKLVICSTLFFVSFIFINIAYGIVCDYYINTSTTISSPGTYCLENDITGSITINANDVYLYGKGYHIYSGNIIVTAGHTNIKIDSINVDGDVEVHGNINVTINNVKAKSLKIRYGSRNNIYYLNNVIANEIIIRATTGTNNTKQKIFLNNIFVNNLYIISYFDFVSSDKRVHLYPDVVIQNSQIKKYYSDTYFHCRDDFYRNDLYQYIHLNLTIINSSIESAYIDASYLSNLTIKNSKIKIKLGRKYFNLRYGVTWSNYPYWYCSYFSYGPVPQTNILLTDIYTNVVDNKSTFVLPKPDGEHCPNRYIDINNLIELNGKKVTLENLNITYNGNLSNVFVISTSLTTPIKFSNITLKINNENTNGFSIYPHGTIIFDNVTIIGGNRGIIQNKNYLVDIYNSRICGQNGYNIYFSSGSGAIYNSYFDSVYPNVTAIINYPGNNYWCDGTPRFGPFNLTFISPPTPKNNATIEDRYFTVKVNSTKPLLWCKLIFNNSEYYMTIVGLDRRTASYTLTGLEDGTYQFKVICESLEYTYAETELRTIHVKIKFHNELHLYGYFDLTQNTTLNIKPDEPYKFDISKLPFKFELDKAVITINKIVILPVKQILNTETNPSSYYERHEDTWNQGFGGGTVSFSYLGGISGNYKYTLGLSTFGGSKYVYYTYFDVPLKQQVGFDNQITIHIKVTGKETLTLNKPLVSPTSSQRGIVLLITVFVKNLYTGETEMYGILPNYGALGDLKFIVDEYLQKYPFKSIVRLDYPLSTQGYDFTFNLNSLLNLNSINYKLEGVNIGVLSIIYQPDATTVVFSNKKLELGSNILDNLIKTQALFNDLEVDGTFKVTTLEITAYKPQQEITQPPFYGLRINGNEVYTKTVTLTNISTLEISSENNIILYGSLRIYGTIKVLFHKINDYTYSAYLRYNYSVPFNLENVILYQLPNQTTKIIKQEYYINGTSETWIRVWNETQKYEDITYMFNLTDTTQGYTYTLKSEYYTVFFDPSNGAKIERTRFGDEVYNITYYTINIPNVAITEAKLITSYSMPTGITVTINSTVNQTQNANITLKLICNNQTFIQQETIKILNLTQEYTFDITKYISQFTGIVNCKAIITIEPEIDEITTDNSYLISFTVNLTIPVLYGNITVTVFDAETISAINGYVKLAYLNGTIIAEGYTVNGSITFTNIKYGYYQVIVNATGYITQNRTFYHSATETKIYAYLIPETINATEYGVLQICLYYKDLEPIQDYPVNIYNSTGFVKRIVVNSTGCGSTIVPANEYYTINTTLPNNETVETTVFVRPYTQGFTEAILISQTLTSGNIIPEVGIMYAEILHMEGENNAKYPVVMFLYSSVPQTITLQATLQKFINGTWVNVETKQVNVVFDNYKQTKEIWTIFNVTNETNITNYRAIISIISYENDTNTSNNVFTTQNVTIHIQIDVGVIVIPKQVYVKPGENIELELKTFGNVNLNNKITITITYYDPIEGKTVTTTKEITLETNKNITINQTVPYAPNITITTAIYPINYEKVDINPQNNKYNVKIDVAPDVRIEKVDAPKTVPAGSNLYITIHLLSNKNIPIIVNINNKSSIYLVNIGRDYYNLTYSTEELPFYQPIQTISYNIELEGDEVEDGNTATVTVTLVNTTFVYTVLFIICLLFVIILIIKVVPRLVSRHTIRDFEFIRKKR